MRYNSPLALFGSLASLAAINLHPLRPIPIFPSLKSGPPSRTKRRRRTTLFTDGLNGKRAVARRLRQIEAGSLRVENGLVLRKASAPVGLGVG